MAFSDEEEQLIIETLTEKKLLRKCPKCGSDDCSIANKYCSLVFSDKPGLLPRKGEGLAFLMMICGNCGFTTFHDLKTLGILEKLMGLSQKG